MRGGKKYEEEGKRRTKNIYVLHLTRLFAVKNLSKPSRTYLTEKKHTSPKSPVKKTKGNMLLNV